MAKAKIISLGDTTDEQLRTCAKHCGLDEYPATLKAMSSEKKLTQRERTLLIGTMMTAGYDRADVTDPKFVTTVKAVAKKGKK